MSNFAPLSAQQKAGGRDTAFRPQLTSLIDVMTILLVFLIKSFSVEGELVTPAEDLTLPASTARRRPHPAPSVTITRSAIMSEGVVLASVDSVSRSDSLLIAPLYEWMLTRQSSPKDTVSGEAVIQSDREIHFGIVKKVMYTCSKAGFGDFSVLVTEDQR